MKKVAIIGGGIVGATCAFYLSGNKEIELSLYDEGVGQATKASAGIIAPWFSLRRNKTWLNLVAHGAAFYKDLLQDLAERKVVNNFYFQNGILMAKKNEHNLADLFQRATERQALYPTIGDIALLSPDEAMALNPLLKIDRPVFYAEGGALVDGQKLVDTLMNAAINDGCSVYRERAILNKKDGQLLVNGQPFDQVVLASGAWLKKLLEPLRYEVDVRGQKGQLIEVTINSLINQHYPVFMPEGGTDILTFPDGRLVVGASHENDKEFDLSTDQTVIADLLVAASPWIQEVPELTTWESRVGTRAFTSDFLPFFGPTPNDSNIFVASGLGSSGLTSGPIIGAILAQLINKDSSIALTLEDYSAAPYVKVL